MRLLFGGVQIGDLNACGIAPRKTLLLNAAKIGYGWDETFTANFSFKVDGQADCVTKMNTIVAALKKERGDLLFQNNDGSNSANSILDADTFGGIRCVSGPDWESAPGGQFATWRSGTCTFAWTRKFVATESPTYTPPLMLEWGETVSLSNPPRGFVVLEGINDVPPEAFPTIKFRKSTGTQSGFAVGLSDYPPPATPLFPDYPGPRINETITRKDPERHDDKYWKYRIEWNYQYLSKVVLVALPTKWTG